MQMAGQTTFQSTCDPSHPAMRSMGDDASDASDAIDTINASDASDASDVRCELCYRGERCDRLKRYCRCKEDELMGAIDTIDATAAIDAEKVNQFKIGKRCLSIQIRTTARSLLAVVLIRMHCRFFVVYCYGILPNKKERYNDEAIRQFQTNCYLQHP